MENLIFKTEQKLRFLRELWSDVNGEVLLQLFKEKQVKKWD